jgi:E3 ubiquitin-protein ligase HUWE1
VLISAAAHNAINVAREFLANGIRVNGQLNKRGSKKPHITDIADALHIACERGNVEFVHAVRDQIGLAQFCRGGDTGGWPTSATGGTLVHSAADNEKASAECVAAAIMAESSPTGRGMPVAAVFDEDARGARTPLMIAASAGPEWESCVEALLRDARTYGKRAVRIAIRCQDPQEGCSAVHIAAVTGNVICLEKFLKEDPSCWEVKDYNDSTPLHWASMEGRHETIRVLLETGANRLAIDKTGWIPLLYANFHEKSEAVLYLLEKRVSEQLQTMFTAVASEDDGKSKLQVQKVLNLLATKPAYYDAINNCIRRDMSLLGPVVSMLRECGAITIIDLANRVSLLRNTCLDEYGLRNVPLSENFTLSAQDAWHDFFVNVWSVSPKILKNRRLSWGLRQPSGDVSKGPGPTREAFSLMANELCDGNRADRQLFAQDDARTYKLKEDIDRPSVLKELQCFGELLAYVVLFGRAVLPIPFSKVFLRRVIANEKCDAFTLDDLADVEPAAVKSIKVVLETDHVESLCLTFIDPTTKEETDVTNANLQAFKRAKIRDMVSSIIDDASVHAVRTGLLNIMRKSQIEVLAPEEFGLVAAGSQSIDPKDWRRHALYSPSPEMEWFWDVVERMSADDKSRLLQFSTGSSLLPVGSFAALRPPWTVDVVHGDARKLPTAWTCFNTLLMPRYTSKSMLEERLFCALRHGSAGFAFA